MSESALPSFDVLIVGLGPAGLTAANLLAHRGLKVLAIEQKEASFDFPRAIHLDSECLRIFQSCGLADALLPDLHPSDGLQLLDKKGHLLLHSRIDYPCAYPSSMMFFQPRLEEVLRSACGSYPRLSLQYGSRFLSLTQDGTRVCAKVLNNRGEEQDLEARFLLACDGASGSVKSFLGIKDQKFPFKRVNLKIDTLEEQAPDFADNCVQKFCSSRGAWVQMRGAGRHIRREFTLSPREAAKLAQDPDKAESFLSRASSVPERFQILHTAVYRFGLSAANTWRQGRVFLAGDAAHTGPPYIGQGMCMGLRDAANLAWKLEGVCKGIYPESLLESYQSERKRPTLRLLLIAAGVGLLFSTSLFRLLQVLRALPFLGGLLLKVGIPYENIGPGFVGKGRAAGRLFPQIRLPEGSLSDTLLKGQFAFVTIEAPLSPEQAAKCKEKGLLPVFIDCRSPEAAPLVRRAKRQKADCFIVRPDLYVYASAKGADRLLAQVQKIGF